MLSHRTYRRDVFSFQWEEFFHEKEPQSCVMLQVQIDIRNREKENMHC